MREVFFDPLRRHQRTAIRLRRPRSRGARHRLSPRRRAGQRQERVRFINLPLIAETEQITRRRRPRVSRGAARVRSQAHRRDGALAGRLLRAALRHSGAALRGLLSPGARSGTITRSGRSCSSGSIPARCSRCRCRPSISNGCSASPAAPRRSRSSRASGSTASSKRCECPFLLMHGGGDEQDPARRWRSSASMRSAPSRRPSRCSSREEGGFNHCQVDNVTISVHYMWDWLEDVLQAGEIGFNIAVAWAKAADLLAARHNPRPAIAHADACARGHGRVRSLCLTGRVGPPLPTLRVQPGSKRSKLP